MSLAYPIKLEPDDCTLLVTCPFFRKLRLSSERATQSRGYWQGRVPGRFQRGKSRLVILPMQHR